MEWKKLNQCSARITPESARAAASLRVASRRLFPVINANASKAMLPKTVRPAVNCAALTVSNLAKRPAQPASNTAK
jgi:hypothetical protein